MADAPKTPDDRRRALMDALAESVAEASDGEILAEAREEGTDVARTAANVRATLLKAVDDFEAEQAAGATRSAAEPRGIWSRLGAWLSAPAPRLALATLAVVGIAAAVVYLVAVPREKPPDVAHVNPAVEPPVTPSGTTAGTTLGPPDAPAPNGNFTPPDRQPVRPPTPRPENRPPELRSLPSGAVATADVKTVSIDVASGSPSPLATQVRSAIADRLAAGGVIAPHEDRESADARLRIDERAPGRFTFEFIGDEGTIWTGGATIAGPDDVGRQAGLVARAMAARVQQAKQRRAAAHP